ncbi:Transmembrane protein with metallophosphoesterase domain [Heterocephalus glaber]|uniref:Transmembrane protein with metallophosphoesterase domain n=1 Tax=Heterocephalus glaber TaxID=10181 RepID=G5B9Y0_HETGA|nr:Transmembrane protein with metallophosphoesterase domain [Heterocephalus glaber]
MLSVMGLLNAAQPPAVKIVAVPIHQLPASMNNLKIVFLSDIHLGPTMGRTKMQLSVRMVNPLESDITVIVGDLSDSEASVLRMAVAPLGQLHSCLDTYFVTGNHEYYTSDITNWFALLESLHIWPLHSENINISATGTQHGDGEGKGNDWICLAGVDDIAADILHYSDHGMNLSKALGSCSPDHTTILLAHQPLAAKRALQEWPDINLILSGHTHSGHLFPWNVAAYLLNPFFVGLYQVVQAIFVYVSPGTAYYGIPMQLGSGDHRAHPAARSLSQHCPSAPALPWPSPSIPLKSDLPALPPPQPLLPSPADIPLVTKPDMNSKATTVTYKRTDIYLPAGVE